jgi:hypothetical protein
MQSMGNNKYSILHIISVCPWLGNRNVKIGNMTTVQMAVSQRRWVLLSISYCVIYFVTIRPQYIVLEPFTMPTRYESKFNNVLIMRDIAKYFKGNEVFNIRFLFQVKNYRISVINISNEPCQCRSSDYWADDIIGE